MKICILADVQSAHTKRWARSIAEKGNDVIVVSFREGHIPGVTCYALSTPNIYGISPSVPGWARFHYLFGKREAQKIIDEFDPDIVHAFWATSYGFLGARLNTNRFFISVWGYDITDSPRNPFMKWIVKYSLKKAEKIFCTSRFLLERTEAFVDKADKLVHIPFGVDTNRFFPDKTNIDDTLVIGSTKSFEPKYGLMNLIKAFGTLSNEHNNIELLLVGSGSLKDEAIDYIKTNLHDNKITLLDAVDVDEIPALLSRMDIYVMPSIEDSETFGVAAVEAAACGLPVIGSRIGGIPEVIIHGETGFLVPPADIVALSRRLGELLDNEVMRVNMGVAGRAFVEKQYFWDNNVDDLLSYYS